MIQEQALNQHGSGQAKPGSPTPPHSQGDDEGYLKWIEGLNQEEGQDQTSDDGPHCFKKIDFANGSSILSGILRIKFTSIGEKGSIGKGDREKDRQRRIPDGGEPKGFPRCNKEDIFKYSTKKDSKR